MATFRELINNVDRSESNRDYLNMDELQREFNLWDNLTEAAYQDDLPLKMYYLAKSFDTDSYIGYRVYYFDNEPVCFSNQRGRKCNEDFEWVSESAYNKVYSWFTTLIDKPNNIDNITILSDEDLDCHCSIGWECESASEVLSESLIYKGETCLIFDKRRNVSYDFKKLSFLGIYYKGYELYVLMEDALIPWHIKKDLLDDATANDMAD